MDKETRQGMSDKTDYNDQSTKRIIKTDQKQNMHDSMDVQSGLSYGIF